MLAEAETVFKNKKAQIVFLKPKYQKMQDQF